VTPLSFSLAALALPGLAGITIWASRSFGLFRQHLISVWACTFSMFWFMYWSWTSDFFQPAALLFVMYGVLLFYVKYIYFSDSVALFLSYLCVTGVLFSAQGPFHWAWIIGVVLSLGSDKILGYKKGYDYRWLSYVIMLMMPEHLGYTGVFLAVFAYGLGCYGTAFHLGTFRQDDLWRNWVISLVCILLIQRHITLKSYVLIYGVQGITALSVLVGAWYKKYRDPFPYLVSIFCVPWMYTATAHMTWVVSTMGLLHWAHYVLTHYRTREVPYMTQTMASVLLGSMGSMCFMCAAVCLWSIASQGYGNVFSLGIYGISCIVQFEGLYSGLRSKKFHQSTVPAVYIAVIGILIWSLWSGWIINRKIFFQLSPKI
jgi:hypothetical protein